MDIAKRTVQDYANDFFPAKELFMNDDLSYWAYDIKDGNTIQ